MNSALEQGLIIASYGKDYLFENPISGQRKSVSANRKAGKAVCGDVVCITEDDRIANIEKRQSEYIRPDFRGRPKAIAANIGAIVWLTSHTPPNDPLIAARAILVSRLQQLPLVIIESKMDSRPCPAPEHLTLTKSLAQQCGITWFACSSKAGTGLDLISNRLKNQRALIVGQSGVGKSTLVTQLTGDDSIRTQSVSEATGHGRHTTTTAQLYTSEVGNIELIDAPGMRDIGLWQMPETQLLQALPEITSAARECRFGDCQHQQEPDCGVKAALQTGDVPQMLYDAYLDAKAKGLLN